MKSFPIIGHQQPSIESYLQFELSPANFGPRNSHVRFLSESIRFNWPIDINFNFQKFISSIFLNLAFCSTLALSGGPSKKFIGSKNQFLMLVLCHISSAKRTPFAKDANKFKEFMLMEFLRRVSKFLHRNASTSPDNESALFSKGSTGLRTMTMIFN